MGLFQQTFALNAKHDIDAFIVYTFITISLLIKSAVVNIHDYVYELNSRLQIQEKQLKSRERKKKEKRMKN